MRFERVRCPTSLLFLLFPADLDLLFSFRTARRRGKATIKKSAVLILLTVRLGFLSLTESP